MQALQLRATDGPQSASLAEVGRPDPQSGEVRVRIAAAALNHRELWISRGQYPGMRLPCTMGCDGAGVIDAVGPGVTGVMTGAEVALYPGLSWGGNPDLPSPDFGLLGMPGPGTVAEYICVPAENAVAKPASLSFADAAASGLAGLTAWRGLVTKARLHAGECVLITGIGGGVAASALQLAVALGARVFVTSSSAESLAKAQAMGAAGGFNYQDSDWRKAVGKATGGIDVVFDGAPAGSYAHYSRALNGGARVVIYGSTAGPQMTLNVPELFLKNIVLQGTNVGNLQEYRSMLAFVEQHRLRPVIDRTFAFDAAADALRHLDSEHRFGKVTIVR
jgi:zinc-binding alcohol dehydrogenase/oxidoreductase